MCGPHGTISRIRFPYLVYDKHMIRLSDYERLHFYMKHLYMWSELFDFHQFKRIKHPVVIENLSVTTYLCKKRWSLFFFLYGVSEHNTDSKVNGFNDFNKCHSKMDILKSCIFSNQATQSAVAQIWHKHYLWMQNFWRIFILNKFIYHKFFHYYYNMWQPHWLRPSLHHS